MHPMQAQTRQTDPAQDGRPPCLPPRSWPSGLPLYGSRLFRDKLRRGRKRTGQLFRRPGPRGHPIPASRPRSQLALLTTVDERIRSNFHGPSKMVNQRPSSTRGRHRGRARPEESSRTLDNGPRHPRHSWPGWYCAFRHRRSNLLKVDEFLQPHNPVPSKVRSSRHSSKAASSRHSTKASSSKSVTAMMLEAELSSSLDGD